MLKINETLISTVGLERSIKAARFFENLKKDKSIEPEFKEVYNCGKNYTMTNKERMYALYKATEHIVNAKIPGDFVECGVWLGGSSMAMAKSLLILGDSKRKIHLYDTFEGMTEPTKDDVTLNGHFAAKDVWKMQQKRDHNNWCLAHLERARKNMISTGYPEKNLVFIKGRVEDTIPKKMPSKIALLRLDTDWYESTKHEMIHLFPRLNEGGILILDDYGCWKGAKKAVDEYFAEKNINILLNRVDYTCRIGVKVSK